MKKLAAFLLFGGAMLGVVWLLEAPSAAKAGGGQPLPELISIHHFFANDRDVFNYKISPDGKQIGWIGAWEGQPSVLYRRLDSDQVLAIRADRQITDFWWTQDSKRIFFSWDEHGDENWHLLMADTQDPGAPYVDLTPYPNTRAHVHQVFPDDPAHILILLNRRDPAVFDLYRLNLSTRKLTLLFENPGDISHWVTSPNGTVLARFRGRGMDGYGVEVFRPETGLWEATFSGAWDDGLWLIGHPLDVRRVWALSRRGRDRLSLVRLDLETGKEELVYEDPQVDLDGAWADYETYALRTAWSSPDYPSVHYFDEKVRAGMESFRDGPNTNVWYTSGSRDERLWTVGVSRDTEGTSYYLYDRETGKQTLLGASDLTRFADRFAEMKPIQFSARDGLRIHGYLTLPRGWDGEPLPLVVRVHGGPWYRVRWGFDYEVQFLANRGYAVLDVNYRGSTGYGRRFMNAAIGEFGRKMQDDLVDAAAWAVAKGYADPDRMALYGWDYGGYASVMGLVTTPELFSAGVAASAPLDWVAALESMPPYWHQTANLYHAYLGDPARSEDRAQLRERSPIHQAERIVRPLLLVQGRNDVRGMTAQADSLAELLRGRDVPFEYLSFPDEGHWLQKWENRVRFYRTLENFLGAQLGGRVGPYEAVEIWLGLQ